MSIEREEWIYLIQQLIGLRDSKYNSQEYTDKLIVKKINELVYRYNNGERGKKFYKELSRFDKYL